MIYLVALGGGIGAVMRYLLMGRIGVWMGFSFPYSTLAVNILGSFMMGVLIEVFARMASVPQTTQAFLTVGILGGFTTFSTFSLDVVTLIERGDITTSFVYMLLSVVLSVLGLFLGLWVMRMVI